MQKNPFANKGPSSQSYGFSCSLAWMWELDHKEGWTPKNWCFWAVVPEKTLESPLDWKEIKPVNPKGNQSWIFIRRTDAEARAPIPWPPDVKSWLIRKDPDTGNHWSRRRRRQQRTRWLDDIIHSMDMSLSKLQEIVKDKAGWRAVVPRVTKSQTHLSDETTMKAISSSLQPSCWPNFSENRRQQQPPTGLPALGEEREPGMQR